MTTKSYQHFPLDVRLFKIWEEKDPDLGNKVGKRLEAVLGALKREGYDVLTTLRATIGLEELPEGLFIGKPLPTKGQGGSILEIGSKFNQLWGDELFNPYRNSIEGYYDDSGFRARE